MRRIDEVKNRKMKNVKDVRVLDKKRIQITFINGQDIILCAKSEDYGYDSGMYFEKDNI